MVLIKRKEKENKMAILSQRTIVGTVVNVFPVRSVGEDNKVVNFTVAVSPRVRGEDGEWGDGETEWVKCTAWRRLADNIAESFNVGDRVILVGNVKMAPARTNAKTGEEYPAEPNLTVEFCGIELAFNPAHSDRKANKLTAAKDPENQSASTSSAPAQKATVKKTKPAQEPLEEDEDIFGSSDDDDDFSF